MQPREIVCVAPSRVGVGEAFTLKLKLLGAAREVPSLGAFSNRKPDLRGPFNLNPSRGIRFVDNCLPEWEGRLLVDAGGVLQGPAEIRFDNQEQGIYPRDTRPIKQSGPYCLTRPGFHFIRLRDADSGLVGWANPVYASPEPPAQRIFWGDPHWQTFFSDGIRCPEELFAFARDEGFLDFGALADHMEAVTDRQWEYFLGVTNDYNQPGRFATLVGQEWTHHAPERGAPGHRNIYFRGDGGPVLRSNDPDCDTLEKLWQRLDGLPAGMQALAIPHHSANAVMGTRWELGWNPRYERAVEIYSVWGSSEKPGAAGNPRPIRSLQGEVAGRHVIDALRRGYRLGFVGGGDVHDGRPGHALHRESYPPRSWEPYDQGLTAVFAPALTRAHVFDAIRDRRTYATTMSRIYLEHSLARGRLALRSACEHGLREVAVIVNGEDALAFAPGEDARVVEREHVELALGPGDFAYLRATTSRGEMAWSSPEWGGE